MFPAHLDNGPSWGLTSQMPRRLVSITMVALSLSLSFLHVRENIHESWECHVAAMLVATYTYCILDIYVLCSFCLWKPLNYVIREVKMVSVKLNKWSISVCEKGTHCISRNLYSFHVWLVREVCKCVPCVHRYGCNFMFFNFIIPCESLGLVP